MVSKIIHGHRLTVALVLAFMLCLAACGGGDDDSSNDASAQPEASDGESTEDSLPAGDASGLVVPLDYLQGEWCNSDGEAWAFEGETARFGESHDELIGELPVAVALGGGSGFLISQSDDEFVVDLQSREVTFTRGRC